MAIERRTRTARTSPPGSGKIPDVEYRVVFNNAKQEWNTFRNGAATDVSARKKKSSAVNSAIGAARAELETPGAVIIVTCVEGRKTEIVWRGLQGGAGI